MCRIVNNVDSGTGFVVNRHAFLFQLSEFIFH